MGFLLRTLMIGLACIALLAGIQVPSFVDQYTKRVDARLAEAQLALKPFQDIAQDFHGGSLDALIEKHAHSQDITFQAEALAIAKLRDRVVYLQRQAQELNTDLTHQLLWIATAGDTEMVTETRQHYSFGILLDKTAVICGLVFMFAVVLPLELLAGLFRLLRPRQKVYR